jgi:hypothetical protein
MTIHSKHLQLNAQQNRSVRLLNYALRNNLEHYRPGLWEIDIRGMSRIATDVLDVIRFLALETGTYVNLGAYQQRKVKSLVYQSKKMLHRWR